ncbi:MAG: hypothetical protein EON54_09785 [Alcaligenaceae bacterium]|nr:MAG: hypothetical protein EON54_09785 [Alcaligenaceae bacterium]
MPESQLDDTTSDLVIADAVDFIGICLGSITVSDMGVLRMRSVGIGPICVQRGGTLYLLGVANAGITNEGGALEVRGVVRGAIVRRDGITVIHPEAMLLSN